MKSLAWMLVLYAGSLGACQPTQEEPSGRDMLVLGSLAAFEEAGRDAENADTYWYIDENCVGNALTGRISLVQVVEGEATVVSTAEIPKEECVATVDRYADASPSTFEELHALCSETERADVLTLDERGVLESCYSSPGTCCCDACGEGFHLLDWGFGQAQELP
jgi:hypothetical protein